MKTSKTILIISILFLLCLIAGAIFVFLKYKRQSPSATLPLSPNQEENGALSEDKGKGKGEQPIIILKPNPLPIPKPILKPTNKPIVTFSNELEEMEVETAMGVEVEPELGKGILIDLKKDKASTSTSTSTKTLRGINRTLGLGFRV